MASQKKDTWKFKKWFTVYAPNVFGEEKIIGEMPANNEKVVSSRNINIALSNITNNPSHMYINAKLKVDEVNGDNVTTKLVELRLPYSYMRSLVRRYRSISNTRVVGTSKDGFKVIVKALAITNGRTTHSRTIAMRKEMSEYITSNLKDSTYEDTIKSIMEGRMQSELKSKIEHIAPINKIEIIAFELK